MHKRRPQRRTVQPLEHLDRRLLLASAAQVYTTDFRFGGAGHAFVPAEQLIVPLPSGKLLAVGTRHEPGDPNESDDPGFDETIYSRLNADGSLDRSFGENGEHNFLDQADGFAFLGGKLYVAIE